MMIKHPDGYWVSERKLESVDPTATTRASFWMDRAAAKGGAT